MNYVDYEQLKGKVIELLNNYKFQNDLKHLDIEIAYKKQTNEMPDINDSNVNYF